MVLSDRSLSCWLCYSWSAPFFTLIFHELMLSPFPCIWIQISYARTQVDCHFLLSVLVSRIDRFNRCHELRAFELRAFRSALLSILRGFDKIITKHAWLMELQWHNACRPSWIMGNTQRGFHTRLLWDSTFHWKLAGTKHQLSSNVR